MSVNQIASLREPTISQIPAYLESIIDKKVNNVALDCFDMLVHWFLTTFSYFYPAYIQFYENKRVEDLETKDKVLIEFFVHLREQIPEGSVSSSMEDAAAIRTWMEDNPDFLDEIRDLDLENLGIASLPPEINKLKNLYSLKLTGNPIVYLPEDFNPPKLNSLYLDETKIVSLPEGFNPPQLAWFYLANTPIASLPKGFNPPNLFAFQLNGTQISSLPEDFNPPRLTGLVLSNTPIAVLPRGFNPPELIWTEDLQSLRQD